MFLKFPQCFVDTVNGKVVGGGKGSFVKRLKTCIENKMRNKDQKSGKQRAVRAKGTVGVLAQEYEPLVLNSTEQQGIREHLQNMHRLNPNTWDINEIKKNMTETYELQREDIVKIKEKVSSQEDLIQSEPDEVNPVKALSEIKELWPFLFEKPVLSDHHKRLTGRELYSNAKEFMLSKVDFFLMFFTSSSTANIKNLALRLKADPYFEISPVAPKKLLCTVLMTANHFKENIDYLLIPVEVIF